VRQRRPGRAALTALTVSLMITGTVGPGLAQSGVGHISGQVYGPEGAPLGGIPVTITSRESPAIVLSTAQTEDTGFFLAEGLPPGTVNVRIDGDADHIGEWWNDHYKLEDADPVTVVAGRTEELGEIVLSSGGVIHGRVTSSASAGGLGGVWAWVRRPGSPVGSAAGVGISDSNGYYQVADLAPGEYEIHFEHVEPDGVQRHASEWYDDVPWRLDSRRIIVDGPEIISDVDATLEVVGAVTTTRLAGADRYATAAQVSARFPSSAPVVYVTTGRGFADALSAAAAAARLGGPLILVERDSIPQAAAAELVRLAPHTVVVAGGTGVVSASVEEQLRAFAGSGGVRRDAGPDRYATSRILAERAFAGLSPANVLIATGEGFADALAGSAMAAARGMPVLLVRGSDTALDLPTRLTLERIGVSSATIAGGTGVMNIGLEYDLRALFGPERVTRLAGDNRYETAAALSRSTFQGSSVNTAFLATGRDFPDALAGAALAGSASGPLLLSSSGCLPAATLTELRRLDPVRVVLLGGPGSLSSAVEALVPCS